VVLLIVWTYDLTPSNTADQNTPGPEDNPFLSPYKTPLNTPPFGEIRNEHFLPAIKEGIRLAQAEVDAIVNNPAPPDFANTLGALDASGTLLLEVRSVLGALRGAESNAAIQEITREATPLTTAHYDNIRLNEKLFAPR